MTDQPAKNTAEQTADILAMAAAEAATPGADTESAYECPFCVMMRKGGCEDPFKAFMACGEKADKGEIEMAECLKEFEALNICMEKNKEMFDGLLSEMKEEEEKAKQQEVQQDATAAGTAGATTHQQAAAAQDSQQQQQSQHQQGSSPSSSGAQTGSSSAQAASSRREHAVGTPATM